MSEPSSSKPTFQFRPGERAALPERLESLRPRLQRLVIAIDGPAGSGKSTTARAVATRLGTRYLDTGAMYRALTLAAQRAGTDVRSGAALAALARSCGIRIESAAEGTRVFLHDEDVSRAIREPAVTGAVSGVSSFAEVRQEMLERQRALSREGGTVMDGRDIGTVVLPHADLKIFLTAATETRARRRLLEEAERGSERPLAEIQHEIERRDHEDSTRATAPLRRAPDAHEIDTSELSLEEQTDAVLALAIRVVEASTGPASGDADAGACLDPLDWAQPGYRRFRSLHYWLARNLIQAYARGLLGARRVVHPASCIDGSVLVACNHISAQDPPLVGAMLPFEVSFVAKRELFRNPLFGRLIAAFNAFPIRRGTADFEALDRAVQLLAEGRSVLMFPEGTRQKPGRLGASRWGFGYVAAQAQRPIVPAFVRGSRDLRPRGLRQQPLEIWVGEPFDIGSLDASGPPADKQIYEQIGALAMRRIAGLMLRSAGQHELPGLDVAAHRRSTGPA